MRALDTNGQHARQMLTRTQHFCERHELSRLFLYCRDIVPIERLHRCDLLLTSLNYPALPGLLISRISKLGLSQGVGGMRSGRGSGVSYTVYIFCRFLSESDYLNLNKECDQALIGIPPNSFRTKIMNPS